MTLPPVTIRSVGKITDFVFDRLTESEALAAPVLAASVSGTLGSQAGEDVERIPSAALAHPHPKGSAPLTASLASPAGTIHTVLNYAASPRALRKPESSMSFCCQAGLARLSRPHQYAPMRLKLTL